MVVVLHQRRKSGPPTLRFGIPRLDKHVELDFDDDACAGDVLCSVSCHSPFSSASSAPGTDRRNAPPLLTAPARSQPRLPRRLRYTAPLFSRRNTIATVTIRRFGAFIALAAFGSASASKLASSLESIVESHVAVIFSNSGRPPPVYSVLNSRYCYSSVSTKSSLSVVAVEAS